MSASGFTASNPIWVSLQLFFFFDIPKLYTSSSKKQNESFSASYRSRKLFKIASHFVDANTYQVVIDTNVRIPQLVCHRQLSPRNRTSI